MSSGLLRVASASFGYASETVLSGVDLQVDPGRILGVAGPNGGGKTTLFRGLLGLLPPLAGSVQRSTDAIGYVPQRESLDPIFPLSVREVVCMGGYGRLTRFRRLRGEDRRLAASCLSRVGLAHRADEPFATLSGGQRQRVLIARALMARPRLLLLDEPTSGVDRDAQRIIFTLLRDLATSEALAVLIVSHDLVALRDLADEILLVAHGRVQRLQPRELFGADGLEGLLGATRAGRTEERSLP